MQCYMYPCPLSKSGALVVNLEIMRGSRLGTHNRKCAINIDIRASTFDVYSFCKAVQQSQGWQEFRWHTLNLARKHFTADFTASWYR